MPYQVTSRTIEALRATLAQVEQTTDVAANDPSLATLKDILLQRIADLQAVDEAATQQAERSALEAATVASAIPDNDKAASLPIDLAVSLLAGTSAGRPIGLSDAISAATAVAVPDLPLHAAGPVQELPAIVDEAVPGDAPPIAT